MVYSEMQKIDEPLDESREKRHSCEFVLEYLNSDNKELSASFIESQIIDIGGVPFQTQPTTLIGQILNPAMPNRRQSRRYADIPILEGIDTPNSAVTSRIKHLTQMFWAIVVSKAIQTSLPVERTTVSVFNDTTEERKQVVLKLFTNATSSQVIGFWKGLESDIQNWIDRLDNPSRATFLRCISLRIHWK